MRYLKELLIDAAKLPAAIEGKLPAGSPKISQVLKDTANKLPTGPGSPIEIPELPVIPLPNIPLPGGVGGLGLAPRPIGSRGRDGGRVTSGAVGSRGRL